MFYLIFRDIPTVKIGFGIRVVLYLPSRAGFGSGIESSSSEWESVKKWEMLLP